ncbi:MAG: hypothetical protein JO038_05785 [Alphaproteobacteria bacterium]|nr:hypothetical protein [Alphaproteobacteria bacterium]
MFRNIARNECRKRLRTGFGVGLGWLGCAALLATLAMNAAAGAQAQSGKAVAAGPPRVVNLRTLPTLRAGATGLGAQTQLPFNGMSPSEYIARKSAIANSGAALAGTPAPGAAAPPTNQSVISIAGNNEAECGNQNPADTAIAIGDGQNPIVQLNEQCLSVWSTSGTRLYGPVSLASFAGLSPAPAAIGLPRALYDWYNHRFIIAFRDSDLQQSSHYDIVISETDDPTGSWFHYRIPTPTQSGVLNQFIRLGQDRQGVYVASNLFPVGGGDNFISEEWLFLPKSQLYAGTSVEFWALVPPQVNGLTTDSTQPANVWSPYDNPRAEFMLTSYNINSGGGSCTNSCNGLIVWAVSNPFGFINGGPTPEITHTAIATANNYSLPPSAAQPQKSPDLIDTGDTRISGEVTYGSGFLYGALTTAAAQSGAAGIIDYKINPALNGNDANCTGNYANSCPQISGARIENESLLNPFPGTSFFYPAPQPDLEGNVTTVFSVCGPDVYLSFGYASQRVTQPPDSFYDQGVFFGQEAKTVFTGFYWGSYTAVSPAGVLFKPGIGQVPATPGFGYSAPYLASATTWSTRIGYVEYTAPNQP